jgi:hypothetical protein
VTASKLGLGLVKDNMVVHRQLLLLCTVAACGGNDSGNVDASVARDSSVDADTRCDGGGLCFELAPVDGVTQLPPGRIGIAWLARQSGGEPEIALGEPWSESSITQIELSKISAPDETHRWNGPCGSSVLFASAIVVLSTDPDGSGMLSGVEIIDGLGTGDSYGILQDIITWTSNDCPPTSTFPQGIPAGVHVFSATTPAHRHDGVLVEMQTCRPRSGDCDRLHDPF